MSLHQRPGGEPEAGALRAGSPAAQGGGLSREYSLAGSKAARVAVGFTGSAVCQAGLGALVAERWSAAMGLGAPAAGPQSAVAVLVCPGA